MTNQELYDKKVRLEKFLKEVKNSPDNPYIEDVKQAVHSAIDEIEMELTRIGLVDWNSFSDTLIRLGENKDKTISRHSKGLLSALKL